LRSSSRDPKKISQSHASRLSAVLDLTDCWIHSIKYPHTRLHTPINKYVTKNRLGQFFTPNRMNLGKLALPLMPNKCV
jgi:hypothetical protein